jgi:threonine dehydratase
MIGRAAIAATYERIAPFIRRTPVIEAGVPGVATPVALKLELLQHSGSFKARGAFANLLGSTVPAAGVAAASGGNHGAAVAYAAMRLGIPARIFVPDIASPAKLARIGSYGAAIVQGGANYSEALAACMTHVNAAGALNIHAYDAEPTLLGQGSVGLEIEEQLPEIDTLLVAVGGGGLIGGIAAWFASRIRVVGVEPETSNALHAALAAGQPVKVEPSGIAADSLGASFAGKLALAIARRHVDHVALVSDDDIRRAQCWLWEHARLVTEPGGAAALAALLAGRYRPEQGERIAVLVCGANTELQSFAQSIASLT